MAPPGMAGVQTLPAALPIAGARPAAGTRCFPRVIVTAGQGRMANRNHQNPVNSGHSRQTGDDGKLSAPLFAAWQHR
tara:strand:+ start:322 stop:552 length:231 start_codon:yes stop_codon:yes gene_type:complete